MNNNTKPEPRKSLQQIAKERRETSEPIIVAPFTFRQFHDEPRLQIVYNPLDSMGRTGAVLDLEEMEELEALIRFIKSAPKVREP